MFHDQTQATERRVMRFYGQSDQQTPSSSLKSVSSTSSRKPGPLTFDPAVLLCIPSAPTPDVEQLALGFFFDRFVLVPKYSEAARGFLGVLPLLYGKASASSPLSSAARAISLAAYADDPARKVLFAQARSKYGEALARVNEALQDPVAAKKDETLMTVLLLGLLQNHLQLLTPPMESLPLFGAHAAGAVALIKMRGDEMFQSETSLKLLYAVRSQMIVSHLHQAKPLDDFHNMASMVKLARIMTPLAGKANAVHNLGTITANIPYLRALANTVLDKERLSPISPVLDLIERCESVDETLVFWLENMPEGWRYTTVDCGNDASGYPGKIDVYKDPWIARTWNSWRTARLYLQAIILHCIAWLSRTPVLGLNDENTDPAWTATATRARETLQCMVDGICASVPSHGYDQTEEPGSPVIGCLQSYVLESMRSTFKTTTTTNSSESLLTTAAVGGDPNEHLQGIKGYLLIWPLIVARSALLIPESQKRWITSKIQRISQHSGLVQAIMSRIDGDKVHPLFVGTPIPDVKQTLPVKNAAEAWQPL